MNNVDFTSLTQTITNNTNQTTTEVTQTQNVNVGCTPDQIIALGGASALCPFSYTFSGIDISLSTTGSGQTQGFANSNVTSDQATNIQNSLSNALNAAISQSSDALGGLANMFSGPHSQTTNIAVTNQINTSVSDICNTSNITENIAAVASSQTGNFCACTFSDSKNFDFTAVSQASAVANSLVSSVVSNIMSSDVGNQIASTVAATQAAANTTLAVDFSGLVPIAIAAAVVVGLVALVIVLKPKKKPAGFGGAPPGYGAPPPYYPPPPQQPMQAGPYGPPPPGYA